MNALDVVPFSPGRAEAWDRLVSASWNGTMLHSQRFLSYHGNRFQDASLVVDAGGSMWGVIPAARDPDDAKRVVSHPGATYGGIVHAGELQGPAMREALTLAYQAWKRAGFSTLLYKAVPAFYHRVPSEEDLYWLWRSEGRLSRVDLTVLVPAARELPMSKGRKHSLKKAPSRGISASADPAHLDPFWEVLLENLAARHRAKPVHSKEDMRSLMARFQEDIRLDTAWLDGRLVAGIICFRAGAVEHLQYTAVDDVGRRSGALDFLLAGAIARSRAAGLHSFDFGISNEDEGRLLNESLYGFKTSFGAGTAIHAFFEVDLDRAIQAMDDAARQAEA